jgi:hypothetical protein
MYNYSPFHYPKRIDEASTVPIIGSPLLSVHVDTELKLFAR